MIKILKDLTTEGCSLMSKVGLQKEIKREPFCFVLKAEKRSETYESVTSSDTTKSKRSKIGEIDHS